MINQLFPKLLVGVTYDLITLKLLDLGIESFLDPDKSFLVWVIGTLMAVGRLVKLYMEIKQSKKDFKLSEDKAAINVEKFKKIQLENKSLEEDLRERVLANDAVHLQNESLRLDNEAKELALLHSLKEASMKEILGDEMVQDKLKDPESFNKSVIDFYKKKQ